MCWCGRGSLALWPEGADDEGRPRALAARYVNAEKHARTGRPAGAAAERLAVASHLHSAGDLTGVMRTVREAWRGIDAARLGSAAELRIRAMGTEGLIGAELGEGAAGVEPTRRALDPALGAGPGARTYLYTDALEQSASCSAAPAGGTAPSRPVLPRAPSLGLAKSRNRVRSPSRAKPWWKKRLTPWSRILAPVPQPLRHQPEQLAQHPGTPERDLLRRARLTR
ncbi:hypothetical protein [Streptomyces sp. CC208A]|uniref:hypothetical protein n=1 Tax=Streptomyces sp. CC208A TaxID=3044573 RepID=UPI0024A92465|nr:hypothetical protein [Streptomyces sp. CC208A]